MSFDVARVRGLFPTLGDGYIHLDGPAGTLIPESVARAVGAALRVALSDRDGPFPSSTRADALADAARRAVADLVGADPAGVVLGPNTTTLTHTLADALARTWRIGDEVVVSRLDHDANIQPWVRAAERAGVAVKWAEVDIETCDLPEWQFSRLINQRTRLVAVTAASNAVGTCPNVRAIADLAHQVGALVFVDGCQAAAHLPVDVESLGADFFTTSTYKWGGPHLAALVAAPELLDQFRSARSGRQASEVARRFELGALAVELLAGVVAAVDHLSALDDAARGGRRDRLLTSMRALRSYEAGVFRQLVEGMHRLPRVTVLGPPADPVPILSFTVDGWKPRAVTEELARRGICAWDGAFSSHELFDALGVAELGGAVRVGLVHYNTVHEVDRLLDTLAALR